jgi:hypothetical protein
MLDPLLQQEDFVKKGKITLLVLLITFSFFFHKILGPYHEIFSNPLVLSAIYAFVAYWGFIWTLSFKVNSKIILHIAPQLSLIIFSEILFLDMFFDKAFGRLYETLLMISLLLILFFLTYVIFLTSNIFAVSSFKKIPLEAVAKTIIYIISAVSVFFVTYGFFLLDISTVFSVIMLLILYFLYIIFLLSHFYIETSTILSNGFLAFWSVILVLIGAVLYSSRVEFIALLMTTVFYFSIGLFISKREQITGLKIAEYIFILAIIMSFSYYFSFLF